MKKALSIFLPFIGLGIFIYIIIDTGLGSIANTFAQVRWGRFFLLPLFIAFIIFIRGYRWQYLMRMVGIEYSMARSASVWSIGFFAAAITPGKIGDALRAYYVSRDTGRNFGESFLTVFIDRLMDLGAVVLFGIFTTLVFSYRYMELSSLGVVLAAVLGILAVVLVILRRDLMKILLKPAFNFLLPRKYRERAVVSFNSFYDSLSIYVKHWPGTVAAFLLTLAYWVVVFVMAYYVAYAMEVHVSFTYLFLIMPMVTLVELVPVSISGLGTREATVKFFFGLVGLSSAQAVGFSLAYMVGGTYLTALVGFFLWLRNPVKLS